LPPYIDPQILDVPAALVQVNAKKEFEPDKATRSSQWLLKIDDRYTHGRIYLPPSLVALTANNIDERQERKARSAAALTPTETNGCNSQKILIKQ
jgi:hypothetical protein